MRETKQLQANVAILVSRQSQAAYVAAAQEQGEVYRFTDARGRVREWLKGEYAYLAVNAAASVLLRWGLKHDLLPEEDLPAQLLAYDTLLIPNAGHLPTAAIDLIVAWASAPNHTLFVTGKTNLPPALLGLTGYATLRPSGYTAWRWLPDSPFGDHEDWEQTYISSYQGYTCAVVEATPGARPLADLWECRGDLTSAATAECRRLGAAIVTTPRTVYCANQVFEYLGGCLQAHLNVEAVRTWSNSTHWGDTLAYFLRELVRLTPATRHWALTLQPFGAFDGVLQLRHDADHDADESIDLAMLEFEVENAVPATHYLMDPAYCKTRCTPMGTQIWIEETARFNFLEVAQHNDSVEGDPPSWITGQGLAQHIRESDRNLGLQSRTAGRHMGFLVYPETLDAMDYLYDQNPDLLGLCTFSLYDALAYGERNRDVVVQGKQLTYRTYDPERPEVPAAISGYWFPYHVVISTTDEHKTLRGWDVTHDTDCDYDRLDTLFAGHNSKNPTRPGRLENGVFTIQYEVQLARDPGQNAGRGHLPWLRYAIARAERHNFWLATKRAVYERLNDYQDTQFRALDATTALVRNETARPLVGLSVRAQAPVQAAHADGWYHIHIVDERVVTLPIMPPGASLTVMLEAEAAHVPLLAQPNSNLLEITEARWRPAPETLEVRGRAIRKGFLVVSRLGAGRAYDIRTTDSRGTACTRRVVQPDGTLTIPILGQRENTQPIAVVVTPHCDHGQT